jgi:hypothetical protein
MSARRVRRALGGLALGAVAAASLAATPRADAVPLAPRVAPASQRVVMFTDSVGLGAEYALPRAFPDDWDVRVVGRPAEMVDEMERNYVRPYLASYPSWFGDHVVLAIAYNAPYWDWPRLDREIDSIIDTLTEAGVKHVYWVTLREVKPQYISAGAWRQIQPYYWYFPTVNDHLEAALDRHPNLTLVDFAAHADRSGITYDAIHLNNTGAALYSSLIRRAVDGASTRVPDGATTRVHVPGGEGRAAAAVNIATTHPRTAGFLTLHRCDRPVPTVSMHNYRRDQIVAHSGVVPLDAGGDFCVTTRSATNLVVDVTGTFPASLGFEAITPTRWLDTRGLAGRAPVAAFDTVALDLADVATDAGIADVGSVEAVAVIATATEAAAPGWLRVFTCGSDAATSNVNYLDGSPSPNLVVVEPDVDGRICVTTRSDTHIVVDLFGVFGAGADVDAAAAVRAFDSREPGGAGAEVAAGSVTEIDVNDFTGGDAAHGVVVNLTALGAAQAGYATAYPCADRRPEASTLNVLPGTVVANATIVAPDDAGLICVYSLAEMHLIVDLLGSIGASFDGVTPVRALDTRN